MKVAATGMYDARVRVHHISRRQSFILPICIDSTPSLTVFYSLNAMIMALQLIWIHEFGMDYMKLSIRPSRADLSRRHRLL